MFPDGSAQLQLFLGPAAAAVVVLGIIYPFLVAVDAVRHGRTLTGQEYALHVCSATWIGVLLILMYYHQNWFSISPKQFGEPLLVLMGYVCGCVFALPLSFIIGSRLTAPGPPVE